ncbi:MAG TPA: hypothetical protein PKY30_19225 [Myxococcota bacterium]|nr:hypothetical protein [Myxococcota bacterium]
MLLFLLACNGGPKTTDDSSVVADDSSVSTDDSGGGGNTTPGHYFPDTAPWYLPVEGESIDPTSEQVIAALQAHGWGFGRFQIDFGMEVLEADAGTTKMAFEPSELEFWSPDCDHVPVPLPEGGALEGETAYRCDSDGDCHLIVHSPSENRLYEMWRADVQGETFVGGCLAVWETDRVYPEEGRGDQCTSADAAGYPIAPLLFDADELAAGVIDHAIRFILPNDAILDRVFYAPASHSTTAGDDIENAVPYGARLRLKPDFDMDRLETEEAKVVARALQRYGMVLADGGNIALTARSDRFTEHKYADLGFDSHSMFGIEPQDFEMMTLGAQSSMGGDGCTRTQLTE